MHKNNFDFLRLVFALLVMVTHSYVLSGKSDVDFLGALTHDQVVLSYIGVRGFFVISGYLIFQSLQRSRDLVDYFWKRMLRLFPALLVMLALTVVLGPLVYDATVGSYWSNPEVRSYFPKNASLFLFQPNIKGIFESNPFPKAINGSLWTICYEFTCYMALAAFIVVRQWKGFTKFLLLATWTALFVGNLWYYEQVKQHDFFLNYGKLIELAVYFVGGSLLAAIRFEKFLYKGATSFLAALIMAISLYTGDFLSGFHFVFLPFFVIGFGILSTPYLNNIGKKLGDISYGIYIYGFPVQQALVYFFGMNYITLLVTSVPITMVLSYGSWHLIEKRALQLKKFSPTAMLARRAADKNGSQ